MQPQDHSTSSSQTPSQEPQLQPLSAWPDPASQPPKKKPVALAVIIILLLLSAGGAGAFFWWQSNQPKQEQKQAEQLVALTEEQGVELYFAAVENHMKTPYIVQKAEQTTDTGVGKLIIKLDAVSDFSDLMAPKTKLTYTTEDDKQSKDSKTLGREQIAIGSELYAKAGKDAILNSPGYETGKWYHVQEDNNLAQLLLDSFNIAEGVNTPLGQVPVGKFNDNDRKELMTFIRENKVYTLNGQKAETLNGEQVQRFTVKLDVKKSDELNEKTAQLLGIKNVLAGRPEGTPTIDTFDAWIGRSDKKFKKVHFSISDAGKELGSSTFTFEYPSGSPGITKPADTLDAPRQ